MILPFLLHHANRSIYRIGVGRDEFYAIKKKLLARGKHVNYDVQHFEGKKCNACGGTGVYHGYYMMSGEKWSDTCNRCWGGWYILPMWVCLSRIKYGPYYFHQPLKREKCVKNPFTREELGWEVTDRPIVEGPITHKNTDMGWIAVLILFWLCDRKSYYAFRLEILDQLRWRWIWRWRGLKQKMDWRRLFPRFHFIRHQFDAQGNVIENPFDYDEY